MWSLPLLQITPGKIRNYGLLPAACRVRVIVGEKQCNRRRKMVRVGVGVGKWYKSALVHSSAPLVRPGRGIDKVLALDHLVPVVLGTAPWRSV